MTAADPLSLERFVAAQEATFPTALAELQTGRKRSHWMWFIFPQLRGLGSSSTSQYYGIASLAEAQAYLAHPVLGERLILSTRTVIGINGRTLNAIFGSPDDMKFCSSMTLFASAANESKSIFQEALERYCDGTMDPRTLALLSDQV